MNEDMTMDDIVRRMLLKFGEWFVLVRVLNYTLHCATAVMCVHNMV